MEINSTAPITSHHDILVKAHLDTVWRIHVDVNRWPDWNPDIGKATLTDPLAVGTTFHWETAGMSIPSTIGELLPQQKIAWRGETGGILGIHVWRFAAVEDGVSVQTEESWEGDLPAGKEELQHALDASLKRWLSYLKARAEHPSS